MRKITVWDLFFVDDASFVAHYFKGLQDWLSFLLHAQILDSLLVMEKVSLNNKGRYFCQQFWLMTSALNTWKLV